MSWIPFYADKEDFQKIIKHLNDDKDIAFLVEKGQVDGKKIWKAVKKLDDFSLEIYEIWFIPSGSLPLIIKGGEDQKIADPWSGWTELNPGIDRRVPYFANHYGVIFLYNRSMKTETVGLSAFGWIGNRYRAIGFPATKEIEVWWKKLRGYVRSTSVAKIGRTDDMKPEIYCLSGAYRKIKNGMKRDMNP